MVGNLNLFFLPHRNWSGEESHAARKLKRAMSLLQSTPTPTPARLPSPTIPTSASVFCATLSLLWNGVWVDAMGKDLSVTKLRQWVHFIVLQCSVEKGWTGHDKHYTGCRLEQKREGGGNHNFNIGNSSIMLYYYTICMPVNGAIQDVLWKRT